MSTWTVPVSSTPPSTPGSHQLRTDSLASNPSTTPAGPPPFELSFTPAGAPNFSANGSSQVTSQNAASKSKPDFAINMGSRRNISSPSFKTHHQSKFAGYRHSGQSPTFRVSRTTNNRVLKNSLFGSSPPSKLLGVHTTRLNDDEGDEDELEEEDYNDELEDDNMISESGSEDEPALPTVTEYSRLPSALISDGNPSYHVRPSSENGTPRGIKRSRGGAAISPRSPSRGACREDSAISSIAKGIASQLGAAPLSDPDKLILETDVLLRELYPQDNISDVSEKVLEVALQAVTEKLCTLWHSCRNQLSSQTAMEGDYTIGIGPGSNAPTALKAIFLATLILQLHHPPAAKGKQALALTRANRSSRPNPFYNDSHGPVKPTAVSKVLIDWLDDSHSPYEIALINLSSHQPNPTAHYNFWDLLFSMTLRGQIQQVITLLKKSDFKVAHTAREDGHAQDGYSGMQLKNTEKAIARTVQLLENCPAVQDGDWDMAGNEWCMFRKRVEQTLNNLTILAEGRDRDMDPTDSGFEASNFGIKSPTMKLSQSARQAESHVPWTIYQNLKTMYGVLLGGTTEVVSSAQDWVEATVGLTIWWDGESDEEMAIGSLAMTRRSLTRSQPRGTRLVDLNPSAAYLRRLAFSFQLATEDSGEDLFKINPLNPVEVGLASIFEGNIEEVIGILRGWSLPVASAVIEIGSLGGWYESLPGPAIDGFNDSDLMVLSSYGQPSQGINRDSILIDYAEALLEKPIVQAFLQEAKEGWELSLSVLTRLDDTNMANKHLRDFLSRISLRSDERVDKILDICRNFGLDKDAQAIAEVRQYLIQSAA